MARRLSSLNARLEGELAQPLRVGIGIHCGDAIVGTMGPPNSPNLSAIGDNVNVAARLESESKSLGCTRVVSTALANSAGIDFSAHPLHEAALLNLDSRKSSRSQVTTVVASFRMQGSSISPYPNTDAYHRGPSRRGANPKKRDIIVSAHTGPAGSGRR